MWWCGVWSFWLMVTVIITTSTSTSPTCKRMMRDGVALTNVTGDSEVLGQMEVSSRSLDICVQECCDLSVKDGCNAVSFLQYKGTYYCLLARCDHYSDCLWGQYDATAVGVIIQAEEETRAENTTTPRDEAEQVDGINLSESSSREALNSLHLSVNVTTENDEILANGTTNDTSTPGLFEFVDEITISENTNTTEKSTTDKNVWLSDGWTTNNSFDMDSEELDDSESTKKSVSEEIDRTVTYKFGIQGEKEINMQTTVDDLTTEITIKPPAASEDKALDNLFDDFFWDLFGKDGGDKPAATEAVIKVTTEAMTTKSIETPPSTTVVEEAKSTETQPSTTVVEEAIDNFFNVEYESIEETESSTETFYNDYGKPSDTYSNESMDTDDEDDLGASLMAVSAFAFIFLVLGILIFIFRRIGPVRQRAQYRALREGFAPLTAPYHDEFEEM